MKILNGYVTPKSEGKENHRLGRAWSIQKEGVERKKEIDRRQLITIHTEEMKDSKERKADSSRYLKFCKQYVREDERGQKMD